MESRNELLTLKNNEIQANDKYLTGRFEEEILSYKNDYKKLLSMLKEKEEDIIGLNKTIEEKEDAIASLHDKLLSVVVLEHKIKEIDKKSKNEIEKNNNKWSQKIKEIENTRSYSPNFFHRINDYEENKKKLEISMNLKELINRRVLDKKKIQIEKSNSQNSKLYKSINLIRNNQEKLKESLTEKNKEIYSLEQKNKM